MRKVFVFPWHFNVRENLIWCDAVQDDCYVYSLECANCRCLVSFLCFRCDILILLKFNVQDSILSGVVLHYG
jgi:hypothetical protein